MERFHPLKSFHGGSSAAALPLAAGLDRDRLAR
jgi:hypothetical protein